MNNVVVERLDIGNFVYNKGISIIPYNYEVPVNYRSRQLCTYN